MGDVEPPDVRYARSGDVDIAYFVVGDGPSDLVFVPFTVSTVFAWQLPVFRDFCERLASFSRLILFDKRGMGLSDRVETGTMEDRMDDVRAVLDAVGSPRARSGRPTTGSGSSTNCWPAAAASAPAPPRFSRTS